MDLFGQAFRLNAIPVSFLVDEVGIIRLRGGGQWPEAPCHDRRLFQPDISAVTMPAVTHHRTTTMADIFGQASSAKPTTAMTMSQGPRTALTQTGS